jgi:ribosome-binding factor A
LVRYGEPGVRPERVVSKRIKRLNEQLKRELSDLIRTKLRDPRVGTVTITGVDVAGDLGSARVYVRAGEGEDLHTSLQGLEAAAPFLRTTLGRTLRVRKIPELRFREDRSYEGAQRIERVLSEVLPSEDDEAPGPLDPGSEPSAAQAGDDEDVEA